MSPYEGSHFIRLGTKNNDLENVSSIRKMVIFKGLAISQSSTSPSIDDVLNCKRITHTLDADCPKITTSATVPACQDLFAYYKLEPGSLTNSNQEVPDSSGNNLHAVNGDTSAVDPTDVNRWALELH